MNKNKRTLLASGLASIALIAGAALVPFGQSAAAAQHTVRVGIMSGEDEDVWRVVAANAAQHGIDVKVTTFSDYTQPNEALAQHDLDANSFQHKPYLDAQIAARHYAIVPVGFTYVQPIGLYSRKHASIAALPTGATIGVPNDPSNEGRSLLLLQSYGLIKLRDNVGLLPTARDIASNPKQIKIKELDAGIVGRSIDDLTAAVVNTDWALKSNLTQQDRLATEAVENNPYRNFIAVKQGDENKPWVKTLVASYENDTVKQTLAKVYKGTALPAW